MSKSLKIGVIGDFNFTFNSHHATNMSLDHAADFLEADVNYYWIKYSEAIKLSIQQLESYDGLFFAPGLPQNTFFLSGVLAASAAAKVPTIITGEAFKVFLETLVNTYQLNPNAEKLISDNLVEGQVFEKVEITPHSKAVIQMYEMHTKIELSSSRFSMYPTLISQLEGRIIDIEAFNQFEDPEIISLKNHPFYVASAFSPQISSSREMPHPLVYTFLKACSQKEELMLQRVAPKME
jgi:CTP synthase (UTP-ammonia lyase)